MLLAGVAAWLALAWSLSRGDRSAVPLGAALAATLAIGALVGGLLGGAGLELALRRAIRAALLVAVATWMRSAAGQAGLREVFRRGLHRMGRIPAAAEAARLLEGLDAGPRLVAAGRAAAGRLAAADLRPAPMADALAAWVAGEAAGYVAGGPPRRPPCARATATACSSSSPRSRCWRSSAPERSPRRRRVEARRARPATEAQRDTQRSRRHATARARIPPRWMS